MKIYGTLKLVLIFCLKVELGLDIKMAYFLRSNEHCFIMLEYGAAVPSIFHCKNGTLYFVAFSSITGDVPLEWFQFQNGWAWF